MQHSVSIKATFRHRSHTLWMSRRWLFILLAALAAAVAATILMRKQGFSPRVASSNHKGSIVITKGGTYSGNWESRNSDVAAVEIRTEEPVVIEDSHISGAGFLIHSQGYNVDITVRNTEGYGLPPTSYTGYKKPRRFLAVDEFRNIVVENCYLESTAGIYIGGKYTGHGSPNQSIKTRFNKARNINGQVYEGKELVQFVQFNYRGEVPNAEIAWNEVINRPEASAVEDNINIYNSRGTPASPIRIHNNYIQGAFPYPLHLPEYSGGGIIADSPGTDSSSATAYVEVYENQLVGLGNYCLGIAGGNNIEMHHNRAIVAAEFNNGRAYHFWTSGIWAKDYYKMGNTFNNSMHHNTLAVRGKNHTWRNEIFDSTFAAADEYANHILSDSITKELEEAEHALWTKKLERNNLHLGPSSGL
ncbi:glycosyl hydrolase [Pontibacter anaerobius]|uniref:Glycosyl hydrolase n=1 Tax=Pontibacter anaerobius TaxID=2993940 RepID=A0ABT3RIF9_9BACT|nr:glycosyl hydrolase [Pontibacter anaerobius]MCX2741159.1 glycosyl hydrolase [Pontibacter anaerobius]